ncbi:hypothetical protein OPV22_022323 [Ensete ventricosum]|uniref:Uncharacterized protein n=1 Tax=Ensete ventricosum TaxID=4639 RepID=A0AAV8PBS6_ENSVE|nr:hypothetical protein OPV22_022323 [Ensete ventricosum]
MKLQVGPSVVAIPQSLILSPSPSLTSSFPILRPSLETLLFPIARLLPPRSPFLLLPSSLGIGHAVQGTDLGFALFSPNKIDRPSD